MADSEAKTEGGAKGGGSKLLPALLAVNSLLTAGVLVLLRPSGAGHAPPREAAGTAPSAEGRAEKKDEVRARPELPGPTLRVPDFVVHLRDPEVDRFARLTVEVEVADDQAKQALAARMPVIRDSFIAYLSDQSAADLRGSEAIAKAKGELVERLKRSAPNTPVRGLYVTELVVQ
jgi:flagellar protein FliL